MKKMTLVIFCMVFVIMTNSLSAQENKTLSKNTIGGGFAGPAGFIVGYERAITDKITVSGEIFVYYHLFGLGRSWGFNARGKYYFLRNALFAEIGLGYGNTWDWGDDSSKDNGSGLLLSPGIGYRLDPGESGGFCFIPSTKFDIITTGEIRFRIDAFFGYSW
jgi:hypothetical protein